MKNSYFSLFLIGFTFFSQTKIKAQPFTPEKIISTTIMNHPETVFAFDADSDGDVDVVSAGKTDEKLFWYENLGNGIFSNETLIDNNVGDVVDLYASDIDGDSDLDVFAVAYDSDQIMWFENLGGGNFSTKNVIPNGQYAYGPASIRVADIDGDGLKDVVVASARLNDRIIWYKNAGSNNFTYTASQIVAQGSVITETYSIELLDVDNDGDKDIVSASYGDNQIAWHENTGNGSFAALSIISSNADGARRVFIQDIDGDGDKDIVSASILDDKIAWYENQGAGNFSSENVIATTVNGATDVYAVDLDGDGDNDVIASGANGWEVSWFENIGSGSFSSKNILNSNASYVFSVFAADLNNDGAVDVLSASPNDDKVAWYKNLRLCATTYDSISSVICQGDSYIFEGQALSISGVYYDTLINLEGCDSVRILDLTVEPMLTPTMTISSSSGTEFCDGNAFSFSANIGSAPVNYTLQWKKDGTNIVGENALVYSGNVNAAFDDVQISCLLTTPDQCVSVNSLESTAITLNVSDAPVVNITFDGTVLSTGAGYDSYQWYIDNVAITGAVSNLYTPTQNGEYEVHVINENCEGVDAYSLISMEVENSQLIKGKLRVYPTLLSPGDVLTIERKENIEGTLLITGIDGKVVKEIGINQDKTKLTLPSLSSGVFILVFNSGDKVYYKQKLIVLD
ncbi:MAG: VCBS repeat-containing protein [Flavobacteriales bacterium]|nr:VCBS repeat-containing protein [Flavobacteriales bacterium]